jgi:hypothetical protein
MRFIVGRVILSLFLFLVVIVLPSVGDAVFDWRHCKPDHPFSDLQLDPSLENVLLITESVFARCKGAPAKNAMFGKIRSGVVGSIDYPQLDVGYLFESLPMNVIQISISGFSLVYGHTLAPSYFKSKLPSGTKISCVFIIAGTNDIRHCFQPVAGCDDFPVDVDRLVEKIRKKCGEFADEFDSKVVYLGAGVPGDETVLVDAIDDPVVLGDQSKLPKMARDKLFHKALSRLFLRFGQYTRKGLFPPTERVILFQKPLTSTKYAEIGTGHPGKNDLYVQSVFVRNSMAVSWKKLRKPCVGLKGKSLMVRF